MMELIMTVNQTLDVIDMAAVRIKPTGKQPKQGEICRYQLYVDGQKTRVIECEYGSAAILGIKMLENMEEKR